MGGGFAEEAQFGAVPRSSGVVPQPPLVYAAPRTGGGPAVTLACALGLVAGAEVAAPVRTWAGRPAVQAVAGKAHAATIKMAAARAMP